MIADELAQIAAGIREMKEKIAGLDERLDRLSEPAEPEKPAHPDAALFVAWRGYIKAHQDFTYAYDHLLPNGGTDKDHEPYYQIIDSFRDQLERFKATTLEGTALQLRYLFAQQTQRQAAYETAFCGAPMPDELVAEIDVDFIRKQLWRMAHAATEASGAAHHLAKGERLSSAPG